MMHAQTTAAIINFAFSPLENPVEPWIFCPNLGDPEDKPVRRRFTEDEVIDFDTRVANLAAELKAGGGPMLDEIRRASNGEC